MDEIFAQIYPSRGADTEKKRKSHCKMNYILITSARNEEKFIEGTIQSVVAQTALPIRWVIVDDGSSDRTAEIVERFARQYPWIELVQRPKRMDRNFAAKAHAVNAGLEHVRIASV